MKKNIIKLHRVFAAPVEKVFKAFTDADAMAFAVVGVPKSLHRVMLKLFLLLFANFLVTNNRTLSHRRIFDFNY